MKSFEKSPRSEVVAGPVPVSSMRGKHPAPFHGFPRSYRGPAEREGRREPVWTPPKARESEMGVRKRSAIRGSNGNCIRKNVGLWCQVLACKNVFSSSNILKCGAMATVTTSVVAKDYLVPLVCYCWFSCFPVFFVVVVFSFFFFFGGEQKCHKKGSSAWFPGSPWVLLKYMLYIKYSCILFIILYWNLSLALKMTGLGVRLRAGGLSSQANGYILAEDPKSKKQKNFLAIL